MEFQANSRPDVLALEWIRPDGRVAIYAWGRSDLWNETTGPEWLAHLGQTVMDGAEPVAGIPGPVAHLIAGLRLSAAEYWRPSTGQGPLPVSGAAVYYDAGRLFFVTAGPARLFRARGRHEIFLTEPPYSEQESSFSETSVGTLAEQINWGQDLPRTGDIYLLALGVESEPPQGLKEMLFEAHEDLSQPLQYCRGLLLAGVPAAAATPEPPSRSTRAATSRASAAILESAGAPPEFSPPPLEPTRAQAPVTTAAPQVPVTMAASPPPDAPKSPPLISPPPEPSRPVFVAPSPGAESRAAADEASWAALTASAAPVALEEPPPEDIAPRPARRLRGTVARYTGFVALALLAAFTAWWSLGRSSFGWRGAPWNPAVLDVASEPGGARVSVDGKDMGTSPVQISLRPGSHRVEARLADLGVDSQTLQAKPGDQLTFRPHFAGDVSITNVHPGLKLYAQIDGASSDSVPLVWKGVPAGRHLVSFSGPGVLPWTAEVRVAQGQTATYEANPQTTDTEGALKVSSVVVSDQGKKDGRGDAVRVDSRVVGRTPLQLDLSSGVHSVRVDHPGAEPQVQMVDIQPGQEKFVTTEFDGGLRPRVDLAMPSRDAGAPLIAASYHPAHGESVREMRLFYAPTQEAYFTRRVMTLLDRGRGLYAAPLPPVNKEQGAWKYFVVAVDQDFNEIPSEVSFVGREHVARVHARPATP